MTAIRSLSPISSLAGARTTLERFGRQPGAGVGPGPGTEGAADPVSAEAARAARRGSLDLSVNSITARQLDRAVSQKGPLPDTGSLVAADPKLAKGIEALLAYLREIDPNGAKRLEEMLRKISGDGGAAPTVLAFAPTNGESVAREVALRSESVTLALEATVTELQAKLDGGATVSVREVEITFQARFAEILSVKRSDPLVLDLDNSGTFETTTPQTGHDFDLLGTGTRVRAATVAGGDAFLAWDRNGNGRIDDGTELFGDQNGAADGFEELAKHDSGGDGVIDARDPIFAALAVFRDGNRDGATAVGELTSLAKLGIAAIRLEARSASDDSNGNIVSRVGSFLRSDGAEGRIGNLLLNYLA